MNLVYEYAFAQPVAEEAAMREQSVGLLKSVASRLAAGGAQCTAVGPGKGCVAAFSCRGSDGSVGVLLSYPDPREDGGLLWAVVAYPIARRGWRRTAHSRGSQTREELMGLIRSGVSDIFGGDPRLSRGAWSVEGVAPGGRV